MSGDFMAVFQNTVTENIASQKRLKNMGLVLKFTEIWTFPVLVRVSEQAWTCLNRVM